MPQWAGGKVFGFGSKGWWFQAPEWQFLLYTEMGEEELWEMVMREESLERVRGVEDDEEEEENEEEEIHNPNP